MSVLRSLKRRFGLVQNVLYITGAFGLSTSCECIDLEQILHWKKHVKTDLNLSECQAAPL